jgi:hypothetical protein
MTLSKRTSPRGCGRSTERRRTRAAAADGLHLCEDAERYLMSLGVA